ncbi:MAG: hypothetical protein WA948_07565 [Pontixanthobacter sp.]
MVWLTVVMGAALLIFGIYHTTLPATERQRAEARLAAIKTGGVEHHLEERRSSEAYAPLRSYRNTRWLGIINIVSGLVLLALGVLRP